MSTVLDMTIGIRYPLQSPLNVFFFLSIDTKKYISGASYARVLEVI